MTRILPRFITVAAATSAVALKRPQNWAQFEIVPVVSPNADYAIHLRSNNRFTAGGQEYRLVGRICDGEIFLANAYNRRDTQEWRFWTLASLMARTFDLRFAGASQWPCPTARIWHGNEPQGAADTLMGRGRNKDADADKAQAARKAIDFGAAMAARLAARA